MDFSADAVKALWKKGRLCSFYGDELKVIDVLINPYRIFLCRQTISERHVYVVMQQ